MRTRLSILLPTLILTAFPLLLARPAFAHHPEIGAEAVCDPATGEVTINYISTSWLLSDGGGANEQIDILFDNVKVGEGKYEAPNYEFSGSAPAPVGATSVTVTALAVADWDNGNEGGQSTNVEVQIPEGPCSATGTGRFTGGGHQIRVGEARVTRGLTLHCDLRLSNNLEVNWGGNQFHMTQHTSAICSDDPAIDQTPPAAPLDTMIGVGIGRYNGNDGYTIEFTIQDYGEPGKDDKARLFIYETANPSNVVLNVPLQLLTGGNLQAHYDQPHK